jgi:hypothetical protein
MRDQAWLNKISGHFLDYMEHGSRSDNPQPLREIDDVGDRILSFGSMRER